MVDTKHIHETIESLYARTDTATVDVPVELQAIELAQFAREYVSAASILEQETPQYMLPILQLTGHAVELSIKACIASAKSVPPTGHDLIELYEQAEVLGFELSEPEFAAIVHLRHFYFEDLSTKTRYKARYPTKQNERLGGSVPKSSTFTSIVNSLLDQAAQKKAV